MRRAEPLSDNMRGALWLLASVAGATVMTATIRLLTPDLHTMMLAFLRSAFAAVLVVPLLWRPERRATTLRFSLWRLHLFRGLLIGIALNTGFYAIWHLPLATATILFFMAPVFATGFAMMFLGEAVGLRRWSAIAAGFAGALVILRPGVAETDPAMVIALISSLAFAASLIIGRRISEVDGTNAVFVSSSLLPVIMTLPPALFVWDLPASTLAWALIGVLVLSSGLRTYADIRAYAAGDAGFIAPFSYLRLLTIGGLGYFAFGEQIDGWTLAGGAIIVGATLYISLREASLNRNRPHHPAPDGGDVGARPHDGPPGTS